MLIDSKSTHNFINHKLVMHMNCFIYLAPECKVIIDDGGIVTCSGKFHNIKLTMGDYILNN
ncbi:pepsin/retropepsin-like aspartic protease family protein, partial [Streptomyces gibsoniae]